MTSPDTTQEPRPHYVFLEPGDEIREGDEFYAGADGGGWKSYPYAPNLFVEETDDPIRRRVDLPERLAEAERKLSESSQGWEHQWLTERDLKCEAIAGWQKAERELAELRQIADSLHNSRVMTPIGLRDYSVANIHRSRLSANDIPLYARPVPADLAVKVKELQWWQSNAASTWFADHPFGVEQIILDHRGHTGTTHGLFQQGTWLWVSSLEEAKAAAQHDYTRRILAALETAPQPAGTDADWRDDPSADERWNAGLDFGQTQLCKVLGVDPDKVSWDAATETLDGDVRSVIGNILTARFGDDWRSAGTGAEIARQAALMRWLDGYGFNEDSDEDVALADALKGNTDGQ